ncbi:MAG TPA: hypothetical protein VI341_04460 [Actinomycetota bacterium]
MTDQDVREFLERMAVEEPAPFPDAAPLIRRGRRRAARTAVVGAVGIAAAVAVLFAGIAEIRTAPAPAPAVQPTTTPMGPFTERFDSPLHGLSIGYPSGWRTRAATEPWGHDTITFDAPDVDVIYDPTLQDDLYIALVSEPLSGRSFDDWCCSDLRALAQICGGQGGGGSGGGGYTLDGARTWIEMCGSDVDGGHSVFVAKADRGYVIILYLGDERLQATYDGDWFESVLETVDLRPEDALDSMNPSGSIGEEG